MIEGEKEGLIFQLLGTHLQSMNKEEAHAVREKQARQMKDELLDKYYDPHVPQFIVGDPNVSKDISLWYENIIKILDAQDTPIDDGRPYTFDNENYWVNTFHTHDNEQLDYILVRVNETETSIERLEIKRLRKEFKGEVLDYADHYGLLANILLEN